ncbi:hypothetical protein SIN8267_01189 [Sinobacterium norvegicum]|uniref:Small-conductance mechanosensitive channel n=1 Tax=Sinobacterium norvegicum TaxID=1641715 RepID=A0ABM9AD10_9GAMM|nr:mechanosensitive ion channel domain-containing protein [Sinobacterium norvegicum]CAH0991088.1 hypothetical protein SIN8267_01189 [Sinobacterium norvegicum]
MKILLFIGLIVAFIATVKMSDSAIEKYGKNKGVSLYRIKYITKTINICLILFFLLIGGNISGLEYSQVSIFLSSVFAVIGVALFAQWSILSNITASLIIFFGFPYRVGDNIKVIDKDDDISGVIEEITLFHVLIKRGNELITYPNTVILQKGVIKNPAIVAATDTKTVAADDTPQ